MSELTRERQRELEVLKMSTDASREAGTSTLIDTIHCDADTIEWLYIKNGQTFRDYTPKERRRMATEGRALPDGCLSADTLVVTQSGPQHIADLTGDCTLLTDRGWRQAEVRCFGRAPLTAVKMSRGSTERIVFATPNHRWYLSNGRWVFTDDLLGQVIDHDIEASKFSPTNQRVASMTEQTAHSSGRMVMVDMESGPLSSCSIISTPRERDSLANRASVTLLLNHPIEVGVGDPVLSFKGSFSSGEPPFVTNFYPLGADASSLGKTQTALRSASLIPHVEAGMWAFNSTDSADDVALELGQSAADSLGFGHSSDLIPWSVISVEETGLVEPVYCAIVPGLHRFVLADGILTGNSFPIANCSDAENAIHAVGRAKDSDKARAFIKRRVRALSCSGKIFENWK